MADQCSIRDESNIRILKYPFPTPSESEPKIKRPRVSFEGGSIDNIEVRIEGGFYDSISQVIDDVEKIEAAITLPSSEQNPINGHVDNVSREKPLRFSRFKHMLSQLFLKNQTWEDSTKAERKDQPEQAAEVEPQRQPESQEKQSEEQQLNTPTKPVRDGRPVLTLWGNTGNGPKQLFSSFQGIPEPPGGQRATDLTDAGLPNGISLAKITAFNSQERKKDQKSSSTFGDVFKPPYNLKPMEAPRQSKNLTRGSALTLGSSAENLTTTRPFSDRSHALPSGQWLSYSETANTARPPSPEEKRRQRERALSFGETKSELRGDERYDLQIARDRSLFQTAYGSFAPAYDSTDAVVPEQTRRRFWWSKVGQKRFDSIFAAEYPEEGLDGVSVFNAEEIDDSVESFAETVRSFVGNTVPKEFDEDAEASPKDVEEVLEEISGLLATLNSYQRIRNLSTPSYRPSMKTGNLSTPSKEEFDVYEILKSQLLTMISALPPYAVAKLNGDQLEVLNAPSRIIVKNADFTGTMEPDQATVRKQQATAATNSVPNRVNSPAARPNYQALNAASYNSRAYNSNNRVPGSTSNYQQQNQYRQPNQYSNLAASHPASRGSMPTRPNFTQQYSQSTTPQYQTPSTQHLQRPLPNGYSASYSQSSQQANSSGSPFQRSNQSLPARADSGSYGRSASPQKSTTDYSPYPPRNSQAQPQTLQRGQQSGDYTNNMSTRGTYQTGNLGTPRTGTPQGGTTQSGIPQTTNGQPESSGRNEIHKRSNGISVTATAET